MVEFGCLETKTLIFCYDSEYRADMLTDITSKQKTEKNIRKPLNAFKNKLLTMYKKEAILAANIRVDRQLYFANILEQRLQKAKRYVTRSLYFV